MPTGAVITADIVNSTLLPKHQLAKLNKSLELLLQPYRHEFYRGDSFQVYLKDNSIALELGLLLRFAARRIKTDKKIATDIRIAIGIGEIKGPVKSIRQSAEEPFVLSGRALDALTDSAERLRIVTPEEPANDLLHLIGRFIDYILKDMTSKQAEVIAELVQGNTQMKAAKKLKKSQATINRQVHAAGWPEIERLLMEYKRVISKYIMK